MEAVFKFSSAIILLVAPCYFGYMAQPTEMGLAILAGALGVAFANLDKLSEFSGAGFSAKMRDQVQAVVEKETESTPFVRPEDQKTRTSPIDEAILKALSSYSQIWWMAVRRLSCLTDRLPAPHPETGRCSRPAPTS